MNIILFLESTSIINLCIAYLGMTYFTVAAFLSIKLNNDNELFEYLLPCSLSGTCLIFLSIIKLKTTQSLFSILLLLAIICLWTLFLIWNLISKNYPNYWENGVIKGLFGLKKIKSDIILDIKSYISHIRFNLKFYFLSIIRNNLNFKILKNIFTSTPRNLKKIINKIKKVKKLSKNIAPYSFEIKYKNFNVRLSYICSIFGLLLLSKSPPVSLALFTLPLLNLLIFLNQTGFLTLFGNFTLIAFSYLVYISLFVSTGSIISFFNFNFQDRYIEFVHILCIISTPLVLWFNPFIKRLCNKIKGQSLQTRNAKLIVTTRTTFDPFLEKQDRLKSLSLKLDKIENFNWLSVGEFNQLDNSLSIIRNSRKNQQTQLLTLTPPEKFIKMIRNTPHPISRDYLQISPSFQDFKHFLNMASDWNLCNYLIPIFTNPQTIYFIFIETNYSSSQSQLDMPTLLRLQTEFQFTMQVTEEAQSSKDLEQLLVEARKKKTNFNTFVDKIKSINDNLSKLQKRQSQLIENERWISLNQITVTLNHEINNPLTHVLGMAQLMEEKQKKGLKIKPEDFSKNLNSIYEQSIRIVEIVKAMRRISVPVIEKYLPDIEMIRLDIKSDSEANRP